MIFKIHSNSSHSMILWFSWVSVWEVLIWHFSGQLVRLIMYRWKKLEMKSRKNKTLVDSKSYCRSWEEYCFIWGTNKMLMSEKKKNIQRAYYSWTSFLTSPAKKELTSTSQPRRLSWSSYGCGSTTAPFRKAGSALCLLNCGQPFAWQS